MHFCEVLLWSRPGWFGDDEAYSRPELAVAILSKMFWFGSWSITYSFVFLSAEFLCKLITFTLFILINWVLPFSVESSLLIEAGTWKDSKALSLMRPSASSLKKDWFFIWFDSSSLSTVVYIVAWKSRMGPLCAWWELYAAWSCWDLKANSDKLLDVFL